jgi:chromosome segregation ATPase
MSELTPEQMARLTTAVAMGVQYCHPDDIEAAVAALTTATARLAEVEQERDHASDWSDRYREQLRQAEAALAARDAELAVARAEVARKDEVIWALRGDQDDLRAEMARRDSQDAQTYKAKCEAEAELAALREALESIANNSCCGSCREASLVASAALGKL